MAHQVKTTAAKADNLSSIPRRGPTDLACDMCLSLVKVQVIECSLATADKLTAGSPHTSASSRFVAQELFTMSTGAGSHTMGWGMRV